MRIDPSYVWMHRPQTTRYRFVTFPRNHNDSKSNNNKQTIYCSATIWLRNLMKTALFSTFVKMSAVFSALLM